MILLDVVGFYFDELLGVFEWSRRTAKERLQTVGACVLLLVLIAVGIWLF